jgi:hypothetical protein
MIRKNKETPEGFRYCGGKHWHMTVEYAEVQNLFTGRMHFLYSIFDVPVNSFT